METYHPVKVSHDGTESTVYALKVLNDQAIMAQVAKHCGADATMMR